MKKITFSLLFLLGSLFLRAQNPDADALPYEPMDSWPYMYEQFESGKVRTTNGALLTYASLNICIADGKLHYIEAGKIMQANMSQIFTALLGENDVYVNAGGKMYRVIVETDEGSILELTSVDVDELSKVDIGYGVSSSTASRTNTSLAGLGMETLDGVNMVNMTITNAEQKKNSGNVLPLKKTLYLYVSGKVIPANKREIQQLVDKDTAKAFFKANKIKWNKAESLLPLLPFLKEQLN